MFAEIIFTKNKPIFIQIRDYIKELILKGMLQKNQKLPSTRELSKLLKTSRNTVITAYEYLEDEGFIYILKGKGTFVANIQINKEENWSVNWGEKLNKYAEMSEKLDIVKTEAEK